jgi:hypothetical protein
MSGDSSTCFRGEPALVSGLIQSGHNIEISTATDYQPIFIRRAGDAGDEFNEGAAGSRASIHVVPYYRDSRGVPKRLPCERNAVRSFVTACKPEI